MKKIIITAFFLMIGAQLYVPASMILSREKVTAEGVAYYFETNPIDPRDPFRGQYISLVFQENSYIPSDIDRFQADQDIWVHLQKSEEGFADVTAISASRPGEGNYLKARISHIQDDRVFIEYPFERFYMEETKAPLAEKTIRQASRDEKQKAYAVVYVLAGESVLTDVMIDGKSLREISKDNK